MELILKAENIHLEYSGKEILDINDIEIYSYDRIGLIGDNGCGKSTLLNILSQKQSLPNAKLKNFGSVTYIPQLERSQLDADSDLSLLSRFGVSNLNQDTMSGGEETRTKIATAFSKQSHALFIDEPTCHLDEEGINLLIKNIDAFEGALLVVSHDRYFLDSVVDKIWELKDGKITEYWGGYSEYSQQKQEQYIKQAEEYKKIEKERQRLELSMLEKQKQAGQIDKKSKGSAKKNANESAGRLGHQKSTGTKQKKLFNAAKNLEQRIASLDDVSAPENKRMVRFKQSEALALHNKCPIMGNEINLSFGEKTIFKNANINIPLGAKVAITGANGTGKTSLFKMILDGAEGFNISPKAVIGHLEQTGYQLTNNQSIISFMQEDCDYQVPEIRSALAAMGFGPRDINKSLSVLSGGEIIKILLAKILLARYNILLLDEPSNYLDISSTLALESMMQNYAGTIVFISHDKRLVENVATIVYEIKDNTISKIYDKQ